MNDALRSMFAMKRGRAHGVAVWDEDDDLGYAWWVCVGWGELFAERFAGGVFGNQPRCR